MDTGSTGSVIGTDKLTATSEARERALACNSLVRWLVNPLSKKIPVASPAVPRIVTKIPTFIIYCCSESSSTITSIHSVRYLKFTTPLLSRAFSQLLPCELIVPSVPIPETNLSRFCLRRVALRTLSAPSIIVQTAAKPRSITTAVQFQFRNPRTSCSSLLQKRLYSDEFKTPAQRQAENPVEPETTSAEPFDVADIQDSNSATSRSNEKIASANEHSEDATVASAISSVASNVTSKVSEVAQNAYQRASDAAVSMGASGGSYRRAEDGELASRRPADNPDLVPSENLYLGNLFFDVTEDDLKREFSKFGTVQSVRLVYDGRGLSKG